MRLDSSDQATLPAGEPSTMDGPVADVDGVAEPEAAQLGRTGSLIVQIGLTSIGVLGVLLALRLGLWSKGGPGPGLWPLAAAVLTIAAGLVTVARTVAGARVASLRGSAQPTVAVVLMVAFVLLFSAATAPVALVVFFALWTRLLGRMPWRAVALWTLLAAAALYLLFGVVLATPFPAPLIAIP